MDMNFPHGELRQGRSATERRKLDHQVLLAIISAASIGSGFGMRRTGPGRAAGQPDTGLTDHVALFAGKRMLRPACPLPKGSFEPGIAALLDGRPASDHDEASSGKNPVYQPASAKFKASPLSINAIATMEKNID